MPCLAESTGRPPYSDAVLEPRNQRANFTRASISTSDWRISAISRRRPSSRSGAGRAGILRQGEDTLGKDSVSL